LLKARGPRGNPAARRFTEVIVIKVSEKAKERLIGAMQEGKATFIRIRAGRG
jgi:hypothetical protein